jgi:uncharacterized protein RhaS with RHS repeats
MRWYDARIAQYVLPDPIGLDGGGNFRDYVSNPAAFVDPMGLAAKKPGHQPTAGAGEPQGSYPNGWGQRPDRPKSPEDMTSDYMTQPGHWATEGTDGVPGSIDCPPGELKAAGHGGSKGFAKSTTAAVDKAGFKYGCHTCGSKNPNGPQAPQDEDTLREMKKEGKTHFVPDHIPPAAFHSPRGKTQQGHKVDVKKGEVRLFPQCKVCSNRQKTDVTIEKGKTRRQGDTADEKVAAMNAKANADFAKNRQVQPPSPAPKPKKGKKGGKKSLGERSSGSQCTCAPLGSEFPEVVLRKLCRPASATSCQLFEVGFCPVSVPS